MSTYLQKLYDNISTSAKSIEKFQTKIREKYGKGTANNIMLAVNHFSVMMSLEGTMAEQILQSLNDLKSKNQLPKEMLYKVIQDFVDYISEEKKCPSCYFIQPKNCTGCKNKRLLRGITPSSVPIYIVNLKKLLRYYELLGDISDQDISDNIHIPQIEEEEAEPLTKEMIRDILKSQNGHKRTTFWHMISATGLRIHEAVSLIPEDFSYVDKKENKIQQNQINNGKPYERIMITVRSETTKKKKTRKIYLTREIEEDVMNYVNETKIGESIFGTCNNPETAKRSEEERFRIVTDKLTSKYPVMAKRRKSGQRKITIHSLRRYFVTQSNRIDYGFGHALAGHKQYMAQYDRITSEQKFNLLKRAEVELALFNNDMTAEMSQELDKMRVQQSSFIEKFNEQSKAYTDTIDQQKKMINDQQEIIEDIQKQLETMLYADPNFRKAVA